MPARCELVQDEAEACVSGHETREDHLFFALQDETYRVLEDHHVTLLLDLADRVVRHLNLCSMADHRLIIKW